MQARLNDLDGARKSLLESARLYATSRDAVGVAIAQRGLGTLAYKEGDLDGADEWFAKCLESLRGLSRIETETDVRARQALVLAKRGRLGEARAVLEKCLGFWAERRHPRWVPATQLQLAGVMAKRDRGGAAELYRKARAGYESVGDGVGVREATAGLGALAPGVARR